MPTPETVLMWSAAVILAAVALAATAAALWFIANIVHAYRMQFLVRGLTRAQIRDCRDLAAQFRRQNGTSNGPVSPPVDPIRIPKNHPENEEPADA